MYEAAGRQRKATNADISSGSPTRRIGARDTISFTNLFTSGVSCNMRIYISDYEINAVETTEMGNIYEICNKVLN